MTQTTITRAGTDILMVEQHEKGDREVQVVFLTPHDILDLCLLAWPEGMLDYMHHIGMKEPTPSPFEAEKNPPSSPVEGPEGTLVSEGQN